MSVPRIAAATRSTARCPHCGQTGQLRPVAQRVEHCLACGFIFARPRQREISTDAAPMLVPAAIAPGRVLRERYRLIELIGRGAHGLTYYAVHEFLDHPCVVKILPQRVQDAADAAARRLRYEAQAGFRVNHPNVVRVLDCDAIEGVWYFVMEYVDGSDLAAVLSAGLRFGWQQAVEIATDVASGLAAIHRAGLIHRDIKPANLLLETDGRVRVTDLGVVGLASAGPTPDAGAPAGTLSYAAPEFLQPGAAAGIPADLYSLGATLFHIVTGHPPYGGQGVFRALIDAQSRPVQWPPDAPAGVPQWFIALVLRLLAINPQERFLSAEALLAHLRRPQSPLPAAAAVPAEAPAVPPRGLAILPFVNESPGAGDDWLGFALADSLSRELSRHPGVYVADHEQFKTLLARQEGGVRVAEPDRLLAAGNMVGAGNVITGSFRRVGDRLSFSADLHRLGHSGQAEAQQVGQFEGPLARLVELQTELRQATALLLRLMPIERAAAEPVSLETREQLIRSRQAYLQGDYETAIRFAQTAVDQAPELTEAIQYIGACCARLGRYEEALGHHRRLMQVAEEHRDQRSMVEAHANLGVMYYFKGEYETAHAHYDQAAKIAEQIELISERAHIYNNAGFTLFRLGRAQEAEEAFRRAIEIFKECGALASLIGPYNGMGNVVIEQHRYEEAAEYYRQALALAQIVGDRTNAGVCHMHLGRCASLQGRFADAKNEFALALNTLEETSFWNVLALTYEYMAEMNLRLGSYEEGNRCADRRILLARRHANRTMEAAAWHQKAEALSLAGRATEADACRARAGAAESAGSQDGS